MYDCFRCKSKNLLEITAKCSDMCYTYNYKTGIGVDGYAPEEIHKCEKFTSDYVNLTFCSCCGQIQHPDFRKELTDA